MLRQISIKSFLLVFYYPTANLMIGDQIFFSGLILVSIILNTVFDDFDTLFKYGITPFGHDLFSSCP